MKKILYLLIPLFLASCTKEYIQKPTCFFYMMTSDKFTGEMIPIRTDTIWTSGTVGVFSYACDSMVDRLEEANRTATPVGCENGYQIFHYKIFYP